jgi:hypothetical protein
VKSPRAFCTSSSPLFSLSSFPCAFRNPFMDR